MFVAVRLGTLEELEPNITAYRKAWKEAGHPGEGKVFLRAPVYFADTDEAALREPEESIMYFYRISANGLKIRDPGRGTGGRGPRRARPAPAGDHLRGRAARKDHCRLARTRDRTPDGAKGKLGLDGILCEMNCGTKIPHDRVMKSLQLLCEKVSPRFN